MSTTEKFTNEQLSDRVWRLKDAYGVAMYLAEGDERACLIDTGYGIKGLRNYVETLTNKPVFVLLTHGHVDHAFGAAEFEEVHMSHRDLPEFAAQSNAAWRANFIKVAFSKKGSFEMNEPYAGEFIDVADGEEFDLGGLTVRCHAVPGHTPGCIVPVLVEERMAIFGDAAGPGTLVTEEYAATVSEYLAALRAIKEHEADWDRVLRFHGTCESPKSLLDDMLDICLEVLAGTDDRVAQPASAGDVYPIKSDLPIYLAKETLPGSQQRVDGREGNLFYRADKAC
jgi:glyoxylase-like metal-dependent hydrolase (beta-lactamase superfamily II)